MTAAAPAVHVIVGSTREGRLGEPVARWYAGIAERRDDLEIEVVDLRDWELSFLPRPCRRRWPRRPTR